MSNLWTLDMWTNGCDYIIASSKHEAMVLLAQQYSFPMPLSETDLKVLGGDLESLDFNDKLSISYFHGNANITKTVLDWIIFHGKGYFAFQKET